MLVSIIIPVYNRETLIIETLESIDSQSYDNWECLLIDDHSTDNTFKLVQEYIKDKPRFKLSKRPDNRIKGANSCRNYGFEISKGEYINWFDSDDIMHQDFIFLKSASFTENIDTVISKTSVFVDTIDNIVYKEHRTNKSENILEDFLTLEVSWYLPDSMWKKQFLVNKSLFDEDLFKGQDRDFHTRMLLEQPTIDIINHYLTYYRRHNESITVSTSREVISSFFNSLNKRIALLENNGISNKVKLTFLKLQISNYAQLYQEKEILKKYFFVVKKLFVFNIKNLTIVFKFLIAIISFKILGKGSILLKN